MIPDGLQIQVRLSAYKNMIPKERIGYERIGFHDDFIVVDPHDWDGGLRPGTDQYNQILEEAPFLLVDGELPWGYWSLEEGGWIIDGYGVAI
ncbi:MAG: DUF4832 domain-containing protein [Epulopiscium sp.]|nr:DUF4832 domain-containing protein [Candidatus Epulonipiscium sp.]